MVKIKFRNKISKVAEKRRGKESMKEEREREKRKRRRMQKKRERQ